MRSIIIFAAVVALALAGCKTSNEPIDEANTTITTSIVGHVVGEDGVPIASAVVSAYGKSTTTNDRGVFVLTNVVVPRWRCVVMVRKNGYFAGARAAMPSSGGVTPMRLTLQSMGTPETFSAVTGGAVAIGNSSVAIPGSSIVTKSGAAYNGIVRAFVRYQDPTTARFYDVFSGDMAARRADGSSVELYSYGVLRVVLQSTSGEEVNLAPGAQATLRFPAVDATAPSVPLWHFDETQGIWVEEGSATRQGGFYVGTVTHFTDWNLDRPDARVAFIEGRVTCGDGIPLSGVVVRVGQRRVITDPSGMYRSRVPADVAFTVEVRDTVLDVAAPPVTVPAIVEGTTRVVDVLTSCPARVTIRVVDCDGRPSPGVVYVDAPGARTVVAASSGTAVTVVVPRGRALTLSGHTFEGRTFADVAVPSLSAGDVFDAGDVQACAGVLTPYVDVPLPGLQGVTSMALSSDGSTVVVLSRGGSEAIVRAVAVATGATVWERLVTMPGQANESTQSTSIRFVGSDTRFAIEWRGGCTVLDASTGTVVRAFSEANTVYDVAADGQTILVLRESGDRLVTYAVESGTELGTVLLPTVLRSSTSMRRTADGLLTVQVVPQRLADYVVLDPATGTIIRNWLPTNGAVDAPPGTRLAIRGDSWRTLVYSGVSNGRCYVRRLRDSATVADLTITNGPFTAYALATNDRTLLYGQSNISVAVVNLDAPTTRRNLPIPTSGTGFVSASTNSITSDASFVSCLVFGPSEQPFIRVWDLR
jgi:hypothetical protein